MDIGWIGIGVDRGEFRERQEVLGQGAGSRGSVEGIGTMSESVGDTTGCDGLANRLGGGYLPLKSCDPLERERERRFSSCSSVVGS